MTIAEQVARIRSAAVGITLACALAGCDSDGGMEFTVYGVQVITNSSDTIPAGYQLDLGFAAYRAGRYIFKADANKANLAVRLVSEQQFEQGKRGGRSDQLYSGSGRSVQFERNLSEGKYYFLIQNQSGAADEVSYNITAAEN